MTKLHGYKKQLQKTLTDIYELKGLAKGIGLQHPGSQKATAKLRHRIGLLGNQLNSVLDAIYLLDTLAAERSARAWTPYNQALNTSMKYLRHRPGNTSKAFFSGKVANKHIVCINGTISDSLLSSALLCISPRQRKKLLAKLFELGYIKNCPCGVKEA